MAWTYVPGSDQPKDQVRFLIGDTIADDQLLQDEEILCVIKSNTNTVRSAAKCCEAIVAKLSREADNKLGPSSVNASQKVAQYTALAKKLRKQSTTGVAIPAIETREPAFIIDLFENQS
jgi:hypothetical protein